MNVVKLFAVAATVPLAACDIDASTTTSPKVEAAAADSGAAGKAEAGKFSLKGPGFDVKVAIPEGIADNADVDTDSDLLYPGATLSGLHIEANGNSKGGDGGGVELRFTSRDAPSKVAAWYRDPARKDSFAVGASSRDGETHNFAGTAGTEGDSFAVTLTPASGGGTQGRLVVRDKG